jgi:hypothetical protein
MANTTTRLALTQPAGTDPPSVLRTSIGGNATILDTAALFNEGILASRPAAGSVVHGYFYRSTDTGDLSYSNGSAWVSVSQVGIGSAAASYQSGIASARPGAGTVPAGTLYNATDTGAFAWSNASIWQSLNLVPRLASSNTTASPGELINAQAGITVSLPAAGSATRNQPIAIWAGIAASGASPVTINTLGGGIYSVGSLNASSLLLGAPGASVLLVSDGTSWLVVAGQQDTGWVPLTLASGIASGSIVPSVRLVGDRCSLKGQLVNSTGGPLTNAQWATLPTFARPASNQVAACAQGTGAFSPAAVTLGSAGQVNVYGSALPNGTIVDLAAVTNYSLS